MPFTWVLNLDAELELARPGYNRGAKINAQLETFVEAARQRLLGPGDRVAGEGPAARGGASVGRGLVPHAASGGADASGWSNAGAPIPPSELLRRVNHRRFAQELGAGPPGAILRGHRRPARPGRCRKSVVPWLLKRPLGFAGRGQLRLRTKISAAEQTWIDASLADDGLALEPLVEPLAEYSLHGFLWRDGHYELGRPCVQVTEHGAFQLARLAQASDLGPAEEHEPSGPRHRSGGCARAPALLRPLSESTPIATAAALRRQCHFCALSEINARYTMAFNVGFPRHPSKLTLD